ncbi:D-amino-acid transaminase [Mesorhizobium sp.]|uniref:D-amino-acid transaminase n=1 Tax=Mesorhizobium sp. TaxID=1871066 RepID=UPI000FE731CB|nr:D-amino-acid transaminase [Mesorhizobium sp.]RWJ05722.1 MAG: D-amino-acid transaminase [Mesorhizobium sp.]
MRTVYLNGEYIPDTEAKVSIFDRGFLFADAIYEVTLVLDGKLIDFPNHMQRLKRSARELQFPFVPDVDQLLEVHRELIRRNGLVDGQIYIQITRGNALDRDFAFPPADTPGTILMFTQVRTAALDQAMKSGKAVVTMADLRWQRSDIKTVQLLYSSIAKMEAGRKRADDAWLVRDGLITEGTNNNAFIVTKDGRLVTRPLSTDILHGITRKAVLDCAKEMGLEFVERTFSVEEARQAKEAFSTSATTIVAAVTSIDGVVIGDGKPGPVGAKLREIYLRKGLDAAIG